MPFGLRLPVSNFVKVIRVAGLPLMGFHDLRHPDDILLPRPGVYPKVISRRLGHAGCNYLAFQALQYQQTKITEGGAHGDK